MKEVWCASKSADNTGGPAWTICQKCCEFCSNKDCNIRACDLLMDPPAHLCCWRRSPIEWMMGRVNPKADDFYYKLRIYEYWMRKKRRRIGDGTLEGERLAKFWKEHPKEYQELYEEIVVKKS